jgi:hypothetical protein
MSIFVDCPVCARQLRVPDDLLGDEVKCPTCGGTFAAPTEACSAVPATPRPAVVTETLAPLEVGLRQAVPPVPTLRVRVVEEEKGKPGPARAAQPAGRQLRGCPACGEPVAANVRQCRACGEYLGETDDQPWPRLECEPHRGGLVLGLGITSIVLILTCVLSIVGLPVGVAAWVIGHGDLQKMRAGMMDPEGWNTTHAGRTCGIIGTVLNGLVLLYLGLAVITQGFHANF